MTYATWDDCADIGVSLPEDSAANWLYRASRDIDTLTFCRISERSFGRLTDFQRQTITECTALLAAWQAEHAELLDSPMNGYSINGVSAQFGSNASVENVGVMLPQHIYNRLLQTGLCRRCF